MRVPVIRLPNCIEKMSTILSKSGAGQENGQVEERTSPGLQVKFSTYLYDISHENAFVSWFETSLFRFKNLERRT